MESSMPKKKEENQVPKTKLAILVTRHYKVLAWVGFALWLLTMYAVLFQMDHLF